MKVIIAKITLSSILLVLGGFFIFAVIQEYPYSIIILGVIGLSLVITWCLDTITGEDSKWK